MTTTPTAAAVCECATCRVHRAGLPAGPYTPAEYQKIAPPLIQPTSESDVAGDPEVLAAERARDEARVAFDAVDELWLRAIAEHRSAELLRDPYTYDDSGRPTGIRPGPRTDRGRIAELAEAEKEARERRDRAWAQVVKANDKIGEAQMAARLAIVEAARSGQTGKKGRQG